MTKKLMSWKTKGMSRDLSVSAFNPEFAFENRNLRLSTNDGNTTMSWVNERGTLLMGVYDTDGSALKIEGTPVGAAVINHRLVLFSTESRDGEKVVDKPDHIYVLRLGADRESLTGSAVYSGWLNLSADYPLETLVSYEAEYVQKVYFTDGINQPRVINIAEYPESEYRKRVESGNSGDGSKVDTFFDFVPELRLQEDVQVEKILGGSGQFAPGVIQYAFTYYNKYGQESSIFHTTPLLYISHRDRGGSPEDKVDNAFRITVRGLDMSFDFLRIYSIHRTSLNATPICRRVQDIPLSECVHTSSRRVYLATSDGRPQLSNGSYTYRSYNESRQIAGITGMSECFGWVKSAYPNLTITATDGSEYTWREGAPESAVLWVTANAVSYAGKRVYVICCSPDHTQTSSHAEFSCIVTEQGITTYTDTGFSGDSIDPMELLYKSGESITAYTMEQKDGTLFLGNIGQTCPAITAEVREAVKDRLDVVSDMRSITPLEIASKDSDYKYSSQLTAVETGGTGNVPCGGFKHGDYYRLGIQFQYKTGKWSEPVPIGDYRQDNCPSETDSTVNLPCFSATVPSELATLLVHNDYLRARPVVVFPEPQDRVTLCQGVVCPTMYTTERRSNRKDLYAQSSWFFRAKRPAVSSDAVVFPPVGIQYDSGGSRTDSRLVYQGRGVGDSPADIKQVEIQGVFEERNQFKVDDFEVSTLHSPDIEFDTHLSVTDFSGTQYSKAGTVTFKRTLSDIDIQTSTPAISSVGAGFVHKSFSEAGTSGIGAGLFWDDFLVDDNDETKPFTPWVLQQSPVKFMVYPWHGSGALNNDINRPANYGVMSAELKRKVISNLRIADTYLSSSISPTPFSCSPELFSSDEVTVLKIGGKIYQGNVDTMLSPDDTDGTYFAFGKVTTGDGTRDGVVARKTDGGKGDANVVTDFTDPVNWKTFNGESTTASEPGTYKWNGNWYQDEETNPTEDTGKEFLETVIKKSPVRMKYKSTPHLVVWAGSELYKSLADCQLPVVDVINPNNANPQSDSRFGGDSDDALKANKWVPCGRSVPLSGDTRVCWEYGDTYYQRYDCLKTYAMTPEDVNQIVEIGSFMLETRVNIDGRYDRNRGQLSNINMSPRNFNLLNPVYSQQDNFFTYRIMDDDAYRNSRHPNLITWSLTKTSGADVDTWTNVTLASVLELDGDKGEVTRLARLDNRLLAFQDTGISEILYNESVQVSTENGIPVEIANSGKVQGKRYLSETVGCSNKWSMVTAPTGIYFMDSTNKAIYVLGGQLNNLSGSLGLNTWAKMSIPAQGVRWSPSDFNGFVAYYDRLSQDVLFISREKRGLVCSPPSMTTRWPPTSSVLMT